MSSTKASPPGASPCRRGQFTMAVGTLHVFFVTESGFGSSDCLFNTRKSSCLLGYTWRGVLVARDVQERTRREVVRQGCVYAFGDKFEF